MSQPQAIVSVGSTTRHATTVSPWPRSGTNGPDFAQILRQGHDTPGATSSPATARAAATQLVATALIMPVLASMHESPFSAGPFAPGAGERRFTPLLDQHLADRITASGRLPLIDSVARHLDPAAGSRRSTAAAAGGER